LQSAAASRREGKVSLSGKNSSAEPCERLRGMGVNQNRDVSDRVCFHFQTSHLSLDPVATASGSDRQTGERVRWL
jgi:hypothetical protein